MTPLLTTVITRSKIKKHLNNLYYHNHNQRFVNSNQRLETHDWTQHLENMFLHPGDHLGSLTIVLRMPTLCFFPRDN